MINSTTFFKCFWIGLLSFVLMTKNTLQAQVGIGTDSPNSSAALELSSIERGFLMPRMTEVQRDAILNPALGLTIYQIDGVIPGVYYYSGSTHGWQPYFQVGTPLIPIIRPGSVKDAHIQTAAITSDVLAKSSISSAKIENASITSAKIANATLTGTHLKDGAVTPEKISSSGATDGQVWVWDDTKKSWGVGSLPTGLNYAGTWNASSNTPDLSALSPSLGSFYIVSAAGTQTISSVPTTFKVGDWVIYSKGVWAQINTRYPVTSVFGRSVSSGSSIITAQTGDYTWDQIDKTNSTLSSFEDVDLSSPPQDDHVLIWDDARKKFKPKYEHGHPHNKITSSGIGVASITSDKIKDGAVTGSKIALNTLTSAKIAKRAVTSTKLKGPIALSKLSTTGVNNGDVIIWNAKKSTWETQNLSGGVNYQGVWNATTNAPTLKDGTGTSGHFYTVTNIPGSRVFDFSGVGTAGRSLSISNGDWAFYTGSTWTIVRNTAAVTSIFGRIGNVTPQTNDYTWDLLNFAGSSLKDLSDVSYGTPKDGEVLHYNVSGQWQAGPDKGTPLNPIGANGLATASVTGWHIDDNAITEKKIAASAIVASKIAANSITGAKFKNSSITSSLVKAGSITIGKLAPNVVTKVKIAADAINGDKISDGAITGGKIAPKSITSAKLAAGSISNAKFGIGAVTGAKLAAGSITAVKIKDGSVTGNHIVDHSITTAKLQNNSIVSAKIKDKTITGADIADGAVDEFKIKSNSITSSKIALNTITTANIANASVTGAKIADNAITTDKIKDAGLTTADFVNDAVTGSKVNNNQVDSRVLANELLITDFTRPVAAKNTNAILELRSTTKGFLPPRVTTIQKNAILASATTPEKTAAEGLMVYDTTLNLLSFWDGNKWVPFY